MRIPPPKIEQSRYFKYRVGRSFKNTHSITGKQYKTFRTPLVYVWKRGNEWLYVGSSGRGFSRFLSHNHHVLSKKEMLPNDRILIMCHLTLEEAQSMELYLIRKYRPEYNRLL